MRTWIIYGGFQFAHFDDVSKINWTNLREDEEEESIGERKVNVEDGKLLGPYIVDGQGTAAKI